MVAEPVSALEVKPCPSAGCGKDSPLHTVGTASQQGYFCCPVHGLWREKNPAAVALGQLGGRAAQAQLTPEERTRRATEAATKRWRAEKLARNKVPGTG